MDRQANESNGVVPTATMMNNNMSSAGTATSGPHLTPVQELENAFESCLGLTINSGSGQVHDSDELRTSVDLCVQRFMDSARQLEAFFLKKRLLASNQRPELIILDDLTEIRAEILRKEQILARLSEKIENWNAVLSDPLSVPMANGASAGISPMNVNVGSPAMAARAQMMSAGGGPLLPPSQVPGQPGGPHSPHPSMQAMHVRPPPQQQQQSMMADVQMMPQMHPANIGQYGGQPQQAGPSGHLQQQQHLPPQSSSNLQGPLAYLERTTSNIGMPDGRR